MTPTRGLSPADVHITRHATEQLLLRFPSDLLPRSPEAYLRRLLHIAAPASPILARRYRLSLRPGTRFLSAEDWVLPLVRTRPGPPPWTLPTVFRRGYAENTIPAALRADRLRGHAAFRSGAALRLLETLILESGCATPRELGRLWHARGYPLVLWGGYETFEDFWREAQRATGGSDHGSRSGPGSGAQARQPHQAAG